MKLRWSGIFIFGVFLVTACSSDSPKQDNSSSAAVASTPAKSASSKSKNGSAVARTEVATTVQGGSPLNDAIRSGNDDNIRRAATTLLATNSNDPEALNALGVHYLNQNRPLAAQFLFNKAIAINGNNSAYHNNLGLAYLAQQKDHDAVRELKAAIDLNPKHPEAAGNLGSYYLSRRDFHRAFIYLDQGFPNSNKDVKWLSNYAVVNAWKGNLDVAEKLYQQALQVSPNQRDVLYNFAVLRIEYQHKGAEGLDLLDRIKVMGVPDSMKTGMNVLENHAKAGLK